MRSCVFSTLRNKIQHSMLYSKANKSIPHYLDLPLILLQKSKTSSSSSSPSISSTSSNDQSQSLNARSSNLQQEGLIFNVCHASYRRHFKIPFVITKPFQKDCLKVGGLLPLCTMEYEDSVTFHVSHECCIQRKCISQIIKFY